MKQSPILLQRDDLFDAMKMIDVCADVNSPTVYMGQGVRQDRTGHQYYLLSVQQKKNTDDESQGMIGDAKSEMSRFKKFQTYIQAELNEDEFDNGSLTQSLIVKLKDGMAIVNPAYKKNMTEEEL